jgi:hypothetical protein
MLDDFPFWTTYVLAVVVAVGFLWALMLLIRSRLASQFPARAAGDRVRSGRQSFFFVVAGALALWFLGSSMYLRFHAVAIGPEGIELFFFWPRPPLVLATDDLVEMKLVPAHRSCGHMEVTTAQEHFLSVNFKACKPAEELLKEVSFRIHRNS